MMLAVVLLSWTSALLVVAWLWRKPHRYPPGPPCWPIIGSFFSVPKKDLHLTLMKWKDKYGPVVGAIYGPRRVVMVAGSQAAMEVMRRDEFTGRPRMFFFKERSFRKLLGVVFSDGPFWVEQRRFTLRHLRDMGFGKSSMDSIMHDEVEDLFTVLRSKEVHTAYRSATAATSQNSANNIIAGYDKQHGQHHAREVEDLFTVLRSKEVHMISRMFNHSIVNLLWAIVAGQLFCYGDDKFQEILTYVYQSFRTATPGGLLVNIMPFLRFLIPKWSGYEESMQYVHGLQGMLRDTIKQHKETFIEGCHRDFIDVYLDEIRSKKHVAGTTFTEEGLIVLCMDLFIAGSDTVSNSLEFCLLYMVLYPEVQRAVQEELDLVVGMERLPSTGDRIRLPYTEAVLAEVTRINNIVPVPPPHRCTKTTELQGYIIPEDTMVFINLWGLLHDKEHWGDPDVFRPTRFLDAEGRFRRDDWYCIFGMGKRTCLGESLARNALFVFFASLMQRFRFLLPEGEATPSTKARTGLTSTPESFRFKIVPRS